MNSARIHLSLCCLAVSAATTLLFDSYTNGAEAIAFNISSSDATPTWALDSVTEASNIWSSSFTDDITVNLEIRYAPLDDGLLGYTDVTEQTFDYGNVYEALALDRLSAYDATAVQFLPSDGSFELLMNYTSDHPLRYGSPVPYLDNDGGLNNRRLRLTTANAKALNLLSDDPGDRLRSAFTPTTDAIITLNSSVLWDSDRTDGITPDAYDLLGVATHEIGHALGFVSGTDFLDESSPFSVNGMDFHFPENTFTTVSSLDLFRFSKESVAYGEGVMDWTASATDKYFSIDGGRSPIQVISTDDMGNIVVQPALFSTGIVHGDGNAGSHWKADMSLGLMQPRLARGIPLDLTSLDAIAFDVIGFDPVEVTSAGFNANGFDGAADTSTATSAQASATKPSPPPMSAASSPVLTGLLTSSPPIHSPTHPPIHSPTYSPASPPASPPDPSILAEPMLMPEVAIATVPGDGPIEPRVSASRLGIRSTPASSSTEIPEPRSAVGMAMAIALTATRLTQRKQTADNP